MVSRSWSTGPRHLEQVLAKFIDHYHRARPHQGLKQRQPHPPRRRPLLAKPAMRSVVTVSAACSTSTDWQPDRVDAANVTLQVSETTSAASTRSVWGPPSTMTSIDHVSGNVLFRGPGDGP